MPSLGFRMVVPYTGRMASVTPQSAQGGPLETSASISIYLKPSSIPRRRINALGDVLTKYARRDEVSQKLTHTYSEICQNEAVLGMAKHLIKLFTLFTIFPS